MKPAHGLWAGRPTKRKLMKFSSTRSSGTHHDPQELYATVKLLLLVTASNFRLIALLTSVGKLGRLDMSV